MVLRHGEMDGIVALGGFRGDEYSDFAGYMEGRARGASGGKVELACTSGQLGKWICDQVERLRERGLFTPSVQVELAEILHKATGTLPDDHHIALVGDELVALSGIEAWARERDHVSLGFGLPCDWETRPPGLWHRLTEQKVTPPEGWLVLGPPSPLPFLVDRLPAPRDPAYAESNDRNYTWQKNWWMLSGEVIGLVIERLCRAWSCELEELLAPLGEHDSWSDRADLGFGGGQEVPFLRLHRPR